MLDLTDPRRFELAVQTLNSIESEIQMNILGAYYGLEPAEVELSFKGLRARGKKTKVIFADLVHNESFDIL